MELEFDKEIDAILRKARSRRSCGLDADAGHLDADTIAAFAENALPDKAKLLYMEHFADCDRCRKQLSHAILMNNEADAAAASSVSAPVAEAAIPWYQSIFERRISLWRWVHWFWRLAAFWAIWRCKKKTNPAFPKQDGTVEGRAVL